MKTNIYSIAIAFIGLLFFTSCETNDLIDDLARPGHLAANVYWEIGNTNVVAGNAVTFTAEYWGVDDPIDYLGVWYDIQRNLKYSFTHGGNFFTFSYDSIGKVREFQEIIEFTHSEEFYSADKKSYVLTEQFPTSYTLSSLTMVESSVFSLPNNLVNQVVPGYIKNMFYEQLFAVLDYHRLKQILVVANGLIESEAFDAHFDQVLIEDGLEEASYVWEMKPDSEPILYALFLEVPFPSLVYDSTSQTYKFNYASVYELGARFKVVNATGIENFSERVTIELQ